MNFPKVLVKYDKNKLTVHPASFLELVLHIIFLSSFEPK